VNVDADREFFYDAILQQARGVASVVTDDGTSRDELVNRMVDEVDWKVRDLWRDEYVSVIRDAIRVAEMATQTFGDPRIVSQHVFGGAIDLPHWMGQRALRFILIARRMDWQIVGLSRGKIYKIVALAKLAASFIEVASRSLGMDPSTNAVVYDRVSLLLEAPDIADTVVIPYDPVRASHNLSEEELTIISTSPDQAAEMIGRANAKAGSSTALEVNTQRESMTVIPVTLCGWTKAFTQREWKDPRECVLCRLCGDDDAGLHNPSDNEGEYTNAEFPGLGRLLPMSDGCWVHTSCALWSSEVWENTNDGMIHAAEKARARGSQLKCFGCGRSGATVGCNKTNCSFNYHFPCAKYCGAVFTANQHMFCANHKSSATSVLAKESFEIMKTLIVAPEKKSAVEKDSGDVAEHEFCSRIGSFILHSTGKIEDKCDGFHSENYITPPGYFATRIFWSTVTPRTRTTYMMRIEKTCDGRVEFAIIPGDCPQTKISGNSVSHVYTTFMDRVRKVNNAFFSDGDMFSKLPAIRKTRRKTYGLNGPQVS
jgi:F/Y-rich N-terminus/PHD-like zinc-binding domain